MAGCISQDRCVHLLLNQSIKGCQNFGVSRYIHILTNFQHLWTEVVQIFLIFHPFAVPSGHMNDN
jgi:hypothetical protein